MASQLAQLDPNGDNIDIQTFEQILEMDDDEEEREFSREIVYGFFDQATNTFRDMDTALQNRDLSKLSSLGHFLKGSSATLGLSKVRDSCERMQHLGQRKSDANALEATQSDDWYLDRLSEVISAVKAEVHVVEQMLKRFYGAEAT